MTGNDFETDFAFGIEYVDEDEIESVQLSEQAVDETNKTLESVENKLNKLYNAIQPLLQNLKQNPEKEYIKWSDRASKVEKFSDYLDEIYHGN